jgi:hypothetical protein
MNSIYKYIPLVLILVFSSACSGLPESYDPSFVQGVETTIIATKEGITPDTKTIRQGDGSVIWGPGEEISVFRGAGTDGGNKFISTNTSNAGSVEFSGSLQAGDAEEIWAVYPYSSDNSCDGNAIVTTIPAVQTAVEDNFSNSTFPAIAKTKTSTLSFLNICGGLKFSVSRSDIQAITFKGNNNEVLAGKVKVLIGDQGKPEVTQILDGTTSVTIIAPNNGCFQPGKHYYMTMLPASLSKGYSISFSIVNQSGTFEKNSAQLVKRSMFGILDDVDSKVGNWQGSSIPEGAVDLGLSVYWASCNLGASSPEQDGDYYRWGELIPIRGDACGPVSKRYKEDGLTSLELYDDAAAMNKGRGWRMPSYSEMEELINDCTWEWTDNYQGSGTSGLIVRGTKPGYTNNSIFLSASGFMPSATYDWGYRERLCYWTRDLVQYDENKNKAWYLIYYENKLELHDDAWRSYYGMSIRPIYSEKYDTWPDKVDVSDVVLDSSDLIMDVGDTKLLHASTFPTWATDNGLVWESSDSNVITVDSQGRVTAVGPGMANVTVSSFVNKGVSATCQVTVRCSSDLIGNIDSSGLGIIAWVSNDNSKAMLISIEELQDKDWPTSNSWCESYGEGWRMPTIDELTLIHLYFDEINAALGEANYTQLSTTDSFYWSTTVNPASVFHYDKYLRERLHDGIINTDGEYSRNYTRAVKYVTVSPLDRIRLNIDRIYMDVNETEQLTVSLEPADATHKKPVFWTSSNPSVAIVSDSGLITALGEGATKITAQVEDKTATCSVFVNTIRFEDPIVESICLSSWDLNQDGGLSRSEASVVTSLEGFFQEQEIEFFDELVFFTSLTEISERSFYNCAKLKTVVIPNSVTSIGREAFYGCQSLTSAIISGPVTSIGIRAFTFCKSLVTINLPEPITSIDSHAFQGCSSLTTITIPVSVTSIGMMAFYNCPSLVSATVLPLSPPSASTTIFDVGKNGCLIYVPLSALEAYKKAMNWSRYADRIFPIQED